MTSNNSEEELNPLTTCILCEDEFNLSILLPVFVRHLFDTHHVVIEDVQSIPSLNEYIHYWRRKFIEQPIERLIPSVSIDSTEEKYFVFSNLLKEDRELRHQLRLADMLHVQEYEREDENFEHKCLFCKYKHKGKRYAYIKHLSDDHNLKLGHPQNLVYIDELISKLETELASLKCICCQKIFTDRNVLKEHMRKKQHKCVDPRNKSYDKFYSVNYLDPERSWKHFDKEIDLVEIDSDVEYDDWNETELSIKCLFCTFKRTNIAELSEHMLAEHRFNFYSATCSLDFYQRVKLINYIRRQMDLLSCPFCNRSFNESLRLEKHVDEECSCQLPSSDQFDQPEFYFPTYENDTFLLFLEEIQD